MRGRSFWVLTFVLMVVASHLGFVLFASRVGGSTNFQDLAAVIGTNQVRALSVEETRLLNSTSDREFVHAVCAFDLSSGPVRLAAQLPDRYWSINVYSPRGDVIYTLNDRQARSSRIALLISKSGSELPESAVPQKDTTELETVQVVSDGNHGIAVLRGSLMSERQRKSIADQMGQSSCQTIS